MRNWVKITIVLLALAIGSAFASAQPTPPPYPVCVPTATTATTNYSLTKPGHCALNWDTAYNHDLDLIDTALHGLSTGDGFPIVLGSTSITAGSTTTSIAGLTVNGVTLDATGADTAYLNETGHYSVPAGSSSGFPITLGSTSIGSGSTTTSISGLTVNGVSLDTSGVATNYLDETGHYSVPPGGGSSVLASNTLFAFTGTSIIGDDLESQATAITVTAYSQSGATVTLTNSGTNGLHAGDWIGIYLTGWPANPGSIGYGTGYNLFQVLSSGLSTTQFKISAPLETVSPCAAACGTVESAMNDIPFKVTSQPGMPANASANTYVVWPGATISNEATNYATILHGVSPAVTGNPGYLTISDPWNDIGVCESVATMESAYGSLISQAHTDGWKVVIPSIIAKNIAETYGAGFCSFPVPPYEEMITLDRWLRHLGKNTTNAASGIYWDTFVDLGRVYNDGLDTTFEALERQPGSWTLWGQEEASCLVTGSCTVGANASMYWGNQASNTDSSVANGYIYVPTQDGYAIYQWLNAEYERLMYLNSVTGGNLGSLVVNVPTSINDTTSGGSTPNLLSVTENGAAAMDNPLATFLAPNGGSTFGGNDIQWIEVGHDRASNNDAQLQFNYLSSGSATNFVTLGLYGSTAGIKIDGSGHVILPEVATSASTAVLCPNGTGGALTTTGCVAAGGITPVQLTMPTSLLGANTCTSPATVTMTGLVAPSGGTPGSTFRTSFESDPASVTGWGANGGLTLTLWVSSTNTASWEECNSTAAGITPGAMKIDVGASN